MHSDKHSCWKKKLMLSCIGQVILVKRVKDFFNCLLQFTHSADGVVFKISAASDFGATAGNRIMNDDDRMGRTIYCVCLEVVCRVMDNDCHG